MQKVPSPVFWLSKIKRDFSENCKYLYSPKKLSGIIDPFKSFVIDIFQNKAGMQTADLLDSIYVSKSQVILKFVENFCVVTIMNPKFDNQFE